MGEVFRVWGKDYLVDYTYSFDKVSSEYLVEIHTINDKPLEEVTIAKEILTALNTEIITYEKQKAEDESLGL